MEDFFSFDIFIHEGEGEEGSQSHVEDEKYLLYTWKDPALTHGKRGDNNDDIPITRY